MSFFTTACPRDCYSTCSLKVKVENGRINKIEPHPANQATPEGACLKGLSYIERVYSPDRILQPLQRNLKSDTFHKISWDDALDRLSERLLYFKETFSPQSILYYTATGTKGLLNAVGMNFWRLFGGCTTTYGDLCWPTGLEATRLTLGANIHNAPWDLENAKLIILWGKNPAETNLHQMLFIQKALDKGAKLIVIDPRRTESAERAELLIQPRPGTDGALALAVAHLLIQNNLLDQEFIAKHVHGFEQFKQSVAAFTPSLAAAITEIPEKYIHQLAEALGTIRPATINAGFGMQRYTNSGQTIRALIALLALTGNFGRPGAGWVFANLSTAIFDSIPDPLACYPPEQPEPGIRVSISVTRLGPGILKSEQPPIKMIWIERGNPVSQNPETNTVLKALRSLEFRVVIDQFLTDTAREADLVLPAKTMFEQSDVIGAYWHPYIQLKQKVIDPPGLVKPETEIYYLLARRLGFAEADLIDYIPAPTDAAIEAFLAKKLAPFPDLTLDRLRAGPILAPGHQEIAFADLQFPTPSGKIELRSQEAADRWGANPLPDYIESIESIRREDQGLKYPLYLMTPNTKNRIHSQFGHLPMIKALEPEPFAAMHPIEANKRGIKENDRIRIYNDRGEIRLSARLDFSLKTGCIVVTNGWWLSEGGAVNLCSAARETDMGHGAAFHDNRVQVEKIS